MTKPLAVVFAEEMYECLELHYPRLRLIEAGYNVVVAAPAKDTVYKSKEGYWARSTATVSEIDPACVRVLVIPGGFCTDRLRRYPDICAFTAACWAGGEGAVVAFICHGGWLPVSAKILRGMKVTCFPAIKDDLENAGAVLLIDQRCVVDGRMVTAQTPEDLPEFMKQTLRVAEEVAKK